MPSYNLRNKKTGKVTVEWMSISEMEEFEKDNPHFEVMCGKPLIADSGRVMGVVKPSEDFRDKLRTIQKRHPLGKINIR
jgi:hypothetical protein